MSKPKETTTDAPEKLVIDLLSLLSSAKGLELEDVTLEVKELTLELVPGGQGGQEYMKVSLEPMRPGAGRFAFFMPAVLKTYGLATPPAAAPTAPVAPTVTAPPAHKVVELVKAAFEYPKMSYPGSIPEVQIGATTADGGSRGKVLKIGGASSLPFYRFDGTPPNSPVMALDTFDLAPPLAGPVKKAYREVLEDPVAWAKLCVEKYNADLASIHLVSTDPGVKDTPASTAAKLVEDVLQAVDTPVVVGGSGNPQKDLEVFAKVAEATAGERLVFGSVTTDMDVAKTVEPIVKHGHNLIALAFMDINQARELCRKSLDAGLPKNRLILDPTTGGLGYGIEYSYSIFQRARLSALMGEEVLQVPLSSAATNAWAAREAWQKIDAWGPREFRGPLWEATTALICSLCGAEFFMMMHPLSLRLLKEFTNMISRSQLQKSLGDLHPEEWVKMKV